jgi:hypothetical protein
MLEQQPDDWQRQQDAQKTDQIGDIGDFHWGLLTL